MSAEVPLDLDYRAYARPKMVNALGGVLLGGLVVACGGSSLSPTTTPETSTAIVRSTPTLSVYAAQLATLEARPTSTPRSTISYHDGMLKYLPPEQRQLFLQHEADALKAVELFVRPDYRQGINEEDLYSPAWEIHDFGRYGDTGETYSFPAALRGFGGGPRKHDEELIRWSPSFYYDLSKGLVTFGVDERRDNARWGAFTVNRYQQGKLAVLRMRGELGFIGGGIPGVKENLTVPTGRRSFGLIHSDEVPVVPVDLLPGIAQEVFNLSTNLKWTDINYKYGVNENIPGRAADIDYNSELRGGIIIDSSGRFEIQVTTPDFQGL